MRTIERDTKKLEAEKAELEDKVTEHKTEIALFRILLEQNNIEM